MARWRMPRGVFSMTPEQRDCLRVVCEWFDNHGRTPSYREIARELDLSSGSVQKLVSALVERGWLGRVPYQRHGLSILHRPPMPDFATPEFRRAAAPAGSV